MSASCDWSSNNLRHLKHNIDVLAEFKLAPPVLWLCPTQGKEVDIPERDMKNLRRHHFQMAKIFSMVFTTCSITMLRHNISQVIMHMVTASTLTVPTQHSVPLDSVKCLSIHTKQVAVRVHLMVRN